MVKYLHQEYELFVLREYYGWPTSHRTGLGWFHDVDMNWQWTLYWLDVPLVWVKAHGTLGTSECLRWRWRRLAQGVRGFKRGCDHQESSGSWCRMPSLCPGFQSLYLTLKVSIGLVGPVLCSPVLKQSEGTTVWFDLLNEEKAFHIIQLAVNEKTSQTRHRRGIC